MARRYNSSSSSSTMSNSTSDDALIDNVEWYKAKPSSEEIINMEKCIEAMCINIIKAEKIYEEEKLSLAKMLLLLRNPSLTENYAKIHEVLLNLSFKFSFELLNEIITNKLSSILDEISCNYADEIIKSTCNYESKYSNDSINSLSLIFRYKNNVCEIEEIVDVNRLMVLYLFIDAYFLFILKMYYKYEDVISFFSKSSFFEGGKEGSILLYDGFIMEGKTSRMNLHGIDCKKLSLEEFWRVETTTGQTLIEHGSGLIAFLWLRGLLRFYMNNISPKAIICDRSPFSVWAFNYKRVSNKFIHVCMGLLHSMSLRSRPFSEITVYFLSKSVYYTPFDFNIDREVESRLYPNRNAVMRALWKFRLVYFNEIINYSLMLKKASSHNLNNSNYDRDSVWLCLPRKYMLSKSISKHIEAICDGTSQYTSCARFDNTKWLFIFF